MRDSSNPGGLPVPAGPYRANLLAVIFPFWQSKPSCSYILFEMAIYRIYLYPEIIKRKKT